MLKAAVAKRQDGARAGVVPPGGEPAPRVRATQQRALDTQSAILAAAVEEFGRVGFEGASTRAVAAKAGLQHTLVTYHFKNKEGLWKAAISSILTEHVDAFESRMKGLEGVDDVIKLRLTCEEFIRFSARSLNFHRMMSHVASAPSRQLDWLIGEHLQRLFNGRVTLIRSAQERGFFVQGDPVHLWYTFIGAVTRIFMLPAEVEQLMGRSPYDEAFVDEHVRVCMALFFREPEGQP